MTDALDRLAERGYRRVGLFVARFKDRRIRHKWSAAFASYQRHAGRIGNIPVLIEDDLNETAFKRWHAEHRPDVVVGHEDEAVAWLQKAGWRVPQDTAFFNLSWSERTRACAGLDLRLELQGEVAAETIIAQIQRGELGQPHESREIMVRGRWVEGPTIRAAAG
jgi:LacI family transcriptional regulator